MKFSLVCCWLGLVSLADAQQFQRGSTCQFPEADQFNGEKQVRVSEDTPPGTQVFTVKAFPRRLFTIQAVDGSRADGYFTFREIDRRHVGIVLARSLQELTDQSAPTSNIRFRLACRGRDQETTYLPVTVFIQDINDNPPIFQSQGYNVTIEENTPVGLTIFRGIHAIDRDKPNTPNSDISYSISSGNEDKQFSLEGSGKAVLVLRKKLDYEAGDHFFNLTIMAQDGGTPTLSSTASLLVNVRDVDDMSPRFTHSLYTIQIQEDVEISGRTDLRRIDFSPRIEAIDQDTGIMAEIQYRINGGNEMKYFHMDRDTGQLYLAKEVDRELLDSGKFYLEITAWQKDNELKSATASVEIEVLDLNDNKPEFEVEKYNMTVIENLPAGFHVMRFTAVDLDQPENAGFSYTLEDPSGAFLLQPDGSLILDRPDLFDREKNENITIRVLAVEDVPTVLPDKTPSSVEVDIHLLDFNDNSPVFLPNNVYNFKVDGSVRVGERIGKVQAKDLDQGPNGYIKYDIKNKTESLPIRLDSITGEIFLTEIYKSSKKLTVFVEALDQPEVEQERRSALAVVEFQWPENEERGRFVGAPYEWWLDTADSLEDGAFLGAARTLNMDTDSLAYSIKHNYNVKLPFEIDAETGVVTVVSTPKETWKSSYSLQVSATDSHSSISAPLTVRLTEDEGKERSKEQTLPEMLEFSIKENVEGGLLANLSYLLTDKKHSEHLITNDEGKEKFYLTEEGLLYTSGPLDREERETYMFTVLLGRRGLPRGFRSQQAFQVKVRVEDTNDNSPKFEQHIYQGHVPENSEVGTEVLLAKKISASDADISDADGLHIEIYGKDSEKFRFEPNTGGVSLAEGSLDREEKEVYYLRLRATDSAGHVAEGQLVIHVTDRNDHQPKFLKLQVLDSRLVSVAKDKVWVGDGVGAPVLDMAETVPPGTRIARVLAEDRDDSRKGGLVYSLISEEATHLEPRATAPARERFYVEETSGDIMVKRQVEAKTSYILNISAQDEGGLSTITQIILRVNDINNNKPVFDNSEYVFRILEGEYSSADVGTVSAADEDFYENGEITYSIAAGDNGGIFSIDGKSGAITVAGVLDREAVAVHHLVVDASDHGERQLVSSVNVTVEVLDQNDNQPIFYGYDRIMQAGGFHTVPVYMTVLSESALDAGTQVASILANDTDSVTEGNGLVTFKLMDNKNSFYIHPETGIITTLVKIDRNYNITVVAADQGKPIKSTTALVHIILTEAAPDPANREAAADAPLREAGRDEQRSEEYTPPVSPAEVPRSQEGLSRFNVPIREVQPKESRDQTDNIPETALSSDKENSIPREYGSMFSQEVYQVEIEENAPVPRLVLSLGEELQGGLDGVTFRIVGSSYGMFEINEKTGELVLVDSPDRELRDTYILRIKAALQNPAKKVPLFFYTLYIDGDGEGAGEGEAIVRVNILDKNDNAPEFAEEVFYTSVQHTAQPGDLVTVLQARDVDLGENSELVYTLDEQEQFTINYHSGQVVVSSTSFLGDTGSTFNLLARVEDRGGRQGALEDTARLVVSVLSPDLEVHLLVDQPQHMVEAGLLNMTSAISSLSKMMVASAGVRPAGLMTEVRVYGLEGDSVIPGEQLRSTLSLSSLEAIGVREISLGREDRGDGLGSVEVAVLTIACLVFLGAFVAVLCICCIKLRRSQKHYPAPLAIPLPNYSYDQGGKDMMERQASQRFGTIPRVSTIQDRSRSERTSTRANSERGRDRENRSCHVESSEDDVYLAKSSFHSRGVERRSQQSRHSNSSHRKSVRSVHEGKSSGESSRSRDSGIDDNRDCCSCRQSSVSSRESSYVWGGVHCTRCCGCPAQVTRRHRSSSPTRRSCSLRPRCQSHRSLPRHAHSHHDLRPESDSETESDTSHGRSGSGRRPLYSSELWSRSLTPSQSEARLSQAELRLASTTASRGHSWRGESRPVFSDIKFQVMERSSTNVSQLGKHGGDKQPSIRSSAKKSNLKQSNLK